MILYLCSPCDDIMIKLHDESTKQYYSCKGSLAGRFQDAVFWIFEENFG